MKAEEYVDIGRYLSDVRENFGISLEQAASALNIRLKYLVSIEKGTLEDMPGQAYLRGYIRNYSEYLQLDSTDVLLRYEKLLGTHEKAYFVPQNNARSNMPGGTLVIVCLIMCIIFLYYWYSVGAATVVLNDPIPDLAVSYSAMDKAWNKCLNSEDNICFYTLHTMESSSGYLANSISIKPLKP